jgi:thiol-disulfide isomerase/thioredoxin
LLFFTNPHCAPCDAVLPDIARWQRKYRDIVTIAVISRDTIEANRAKADEHGLRTILIQKRREVVQAYLVESTPAGVLVSPNGMVASAIGYGAERIAALAREASGGESDRSAFERLTPEPALHASSTLG